MDVNPAFLSFLIVKYHASFARFIFLILIESFLCFAFDLFIEHLSNLVNWYFNFLHQMSFESKIQLTNKQEFQFFDDEEESGESHTIFIGPVEK